MLHSRHEKSDHAGGHSDRGCKMRQDALLGRIHGPTLRFAKVFGPHLVILMLMVVSVTHIIAPTD